MLVKESSDRSMPIIYFTTNKLLWDEKGKVYVDPLLKMIPKLKNLTDKTHEKDALKLYGAPEYANEGDNNWKIISDNTRRKKRKIEIYKDIHSFRSLLKHIFI
jgi:hypothetical protein